MHCLLECKWIPLAGNQLKEGYEKEEASLREELERAVAGGTPHSLPNGNGLKQAAALPFRPAPAGAPLLPLLPTRRTRQWL